MHDALGLFAAGCKSHCEERGHQRGRQKGIDFWVHERVDDAGAPNVPETRASQRASNGNERTRKNRPWVTLQAGERPVPTIATLSMTVALEATDKGTHMSRFVELLEAQREALTTKRFAHLVARMLDRLQAPSGSIEMRFTYFVSKAAPVSGVQSQLDYEVTWKGSVSDDGAYSFWMSVMVPATSLCPCSKEISDYGAHNQRSCITIRAEVLGAMSIEDLIGMAERGASCEVYGLLKRPDEKYVTERAYDKPKFVEDIVRDVALALNEDSRIGTYVVEAENFESIHNHSAFARITSKKAL